jgi:hypothetical protein
MAKTSDHLPEVFCSYRTTRKRMNELKRGDESNLGITDAAFEEPEACKYNARSVFLFGRAPQ